MDCGKGENAYFFDCGVINKDFLQYFKVIFIRMVNYAVVDG